MFAQVAKKKAAGVTETVAIDGDTNLMWHSEEAILRAAGAVVAAVDGLYADPDPTRRLLSAFCAVRPPGHHAERNKACGFCFLNNAGIAALHAQACYGIERVAVLDFDVHHGNGTEDGFRDNLTMFYGSTHEKDNFPGEVCHSWYSLLSIIVPTSVYYFAV